MIAALYVQKNGCYADLPDVDLWDEERNALNYDGPHAVVAHPPCTRWCQMAGLVEARYGYKKGDDGGTFAHALETVRQFGGVLEHPAYSLAWQHFDLPRPSPFGWQRGICGGWVTQIDQVAYGHRARKSTWLYACSDYLPLLRWDADAQPSAVVSFTGNRTWSNSDRPRLSKREASATPVDFRDELLSIARAA